MAGVSVRYFVILLAVCLQACSGEPSESEFERLVRETGCTTADAVYRDYQRNEVAAQQKYQGRVNRVCGIVDEIELNLFNEPLISLRASLLGSVSIGGIDTASAANISKGSVAIFECNKINELLGIPVLMECRIPSTFGGGAVPPPPVGQAQSNDTFTDTEAVINENNQPAASTIKYGTCRLQVSGRLMFDGDCRYRLEGGGSFTIYENYGGAGYFAMLERDGNSAYGYWNGARDSGHAQEALGSMSRRGACWTDETGLSEMCVWGA